jgi:hypothetical protein
MKNIKIKIAGSGTSKERSSLDGKIVFMEIRLMDLIWINIHIIQK